MKRHPGPQWSDEQRAAGERQREHWERFFGAAQGAPSGTEPPAVSHADELRVAAVRARHEAALLRYPNVVGLAESIRIREGTPTGEHCLVVYESRKVPPSELRADEILPTEIEGVPLDVVEVGRIEALPLR